MEVELKFLTKRAVTMILPKVALACLLILMGCGSSIEQISGSPYGGPGYTEQEPDLEPGEDSLPPLGGASNAGVSHLLTQGTVTFPYLTGRAPYNGPTKVFQEPPILVRGILQRNNPSSNFLIVSIIHKEGDQSDVLQLMVAAGAQNVTDGTYSMHGTRSGHRATAGFSTGLAVNPEKTWMSNLGFEGGDGEIRVSNFQISPSGGSADIRYDFVKMVNPNETDPGIMPDNIAAGAVSASGYVHVVFGPEQSP